MCVDARDAMVLLLFPRLKYRAAISAFGDDKIATASVAKGFIDGRESQAFSQSQPFEWIRRPVLNSLDQYWRNLGVAGRNNLNPLQNCRIHRRYQSSEWAGCKHISAFYIMYCERLKQRIYLINILTSVAYAYHSLVLLLPSLTTMTSWRACNRHF